MRIIFIEPINVLSSKKYRKQQLKINDGHNYNDFLAHSFEPRLVANLVSILKETDAKIVLYTKSRCCSSKMADMLRKLKNCGLDTLKYWHDTVSSNIGITKNQALEQYIRKHKIDDYIVVDNQLNCDTKTNTSHIFWIGDEGLDETKVQEIIDYFLKKEDKSAV